MDPAQIFIKTEPQVCLPETHESLFQVVPSEPTAEVHRAHLQLENSQSTLPNPTRHPHNRYLAADSLQTVQPSNLRINKANASNPDFRLPPDSSESDRKIHSLYTPVHEPSFTNELGKIVRPLSPTLQCRIQESDMGHIGHILIEVNKDDAMNNGNVCALTAKSLYLSNSGAVISTTDLPYYWCNFCPFKTEQKLDLLKHMMSHRFFCKVCKYQSYNRADVMRHRIITHQQDPANDVKFCVLLPDFLHSKVACEQNGKIVKQDDSSKDISESKVQPMGCVDDKKVSKEAEAQVPCVQNSLASVVCENSGTIKMVSRRGRKRKSMESDERSTLVKMTKSSKEMENGAKDECKPEESFGVCFECCTCRMRTLQKQIIECHQQEMYHNETDKTTGKKTYVLKIVNAAEKSSLQVTDTKWIEERKETRNRTRRSKVEALNSFNSKNNIPLVDYYDGSDMEWDYGNVLDDNNDSEPDDANDEDYVPKIGKKRVRKGRKRIPTQDIKSNEDSSVSVSKVDIEIDTAVEPSVDPVQTTANITTISDVRSYSVNILSNGVNYDRGSPRKIVSRDMFSNSVIGETGDLTSKLKQKARSVSKTLYETNSLSISSVVAPPVSTEHTSVSGHLTAITSSSSVSMAGVSNPSSIINIQDLENPMLRSSNITPSSSNSTYNSTDTAWRSSSSSSAPDPIPRMTTENLDLSEMEKLNKEVINRKEYYKCAHCRVASDRILQIRLHILEQHKHQPLYCLDMGAPDESQPRYMLFCYFKNCCFFSSSRNMILNHLAICEHSKSNKLSGNDDEFKQISYGFLKWTLPKLLKFQSKMNCSTTDRHLHKL